ncbi:MAG: DJ-1/PfpI family protein [Gammaproteobacteria bacterium]|nr:DJ-1/PfpI family protein [Gammaproteobacteria bacterium]
MASVLVPLAEGFEELEAISITDLLTRAQVDVVTAGLKDGPVRASRNICVVPETTIDQIGDRLFDMVVLPGGQPGSNNLAADKRILDILRRHYDAGKFIAAICAAPKVLASAGLLDGKTATSYPGSLEGINIENFNYSHDPIVSDGNVITSRGPGTAMDFALHLVELLMGEQTRHNVESHLQRPV